MTGRLRNSEGRAALIPLVRSLAGYRLPSLRADAVASLTLWALLIPQALAYSSLAGLPPASGLYLALAGMLAYALLGSSRFLTVGPESTTAVIVAATIGPLAGADPRRYASLAAMLAILTAGFLFLGALLRAGFLTKAFSSPVLTGYLSGAGIVIMLSQLSKILGYRVSGAYPTVLASVVRGLDRTNFTAVGVGVGTVLLMLALRRWYPKLPAALVAIAAATALCAATGLGDSIPVVGRIDTAPTLPSFAAIRLSDINALIAPAFSVAVFAFATGVLSARALDKAHADEINPNQEFLALGSANLAAGFVGGFVAKSSESRSLALAHSGARSQVANLVGALLVLLTLLALTPLFRQLPEAALGAVILVTAFGLVDVRRLRRLYQLRTADFVLAAITLAGVLVTGPMGGIIVGVVASLLDVLRRTVLPHTAVLGWVPGAGGRWLDVAQHLDANVVPGILVYRFEAPVFFGNADQFRAEILRLVDRAVRPVHDVIVNAEGINDLDVTGAEAIRALKDDLTQRGVRLSFARLHSNARRLLLRLGEQDVLGPSLGRGRVEEIVGLAKERQRQETGGDPSG